MLPSWTVTFGSSSYTFYTWYHADQFERALKLNGTAYTIEHLTTEQMSESTYPTPEPRPNTEVLL